ncbi:hypothetical protein D3C81_2160410 [compost metagenome]
MTERAENHAETCGRLALALAGIDNHKPFFLGLGGLYLVACDLLLAHFIRVAGIQFLFRHRKKFCRFLSHLMPPC